MSDSQSGFDSYDFNGDDRWKTYFANITIPPGRDESVITTRYKQKFYKQYVDSNFEVSKLDSNARTHSNSSPSEHRQNATRSSIPSQPNVPNVSRTASNSSPNWQRDTILFIFNLGVILMAILSFLPLKSFSRRFFRMAIVLHASSAAYSLYIQHGLPRSFQFQILKQWMMTACQAPNFYSIFFSLIFSSSPSPITLALFPPCIDALIFSSKHVKQYYRNTHLVRTKLERYCAWVDSNSGQLLAMAASCEVSLGFLLIFYLLTPQRSMMQLFLYWQLLRIKWHAPFSSYLHRQAWMQIGDKTEPYLRFVPILNTPLMYAKRWFQRV